MGILTALISVGVVAYVAVTTYEAIKTEVKRYESRKDD